MEVAIHQREEDLECGRREWVEFSFWHKVVSIISISMNDYTATLPTLQLYMSDQAPFPDEWLIVPT
jgi:hypothetical protein